MGYSHSIRIAKYDSIFCVTFAPWLRKYTWVKYVSFAENPDNQRLVIKFSNDKPKDGRWYIMTPANDKRAKYCKPNLVMFDFLTRFVGGYSTFYRIDDGMFEVDVKDACALLDREERCDKGSTHSCVESFTEIKSDVPEVEEDHKAVEERPAAITPIGFDLVGLVDSLLKSGDDDGAISVINTIKLCRERLGGGPT